MFYTFATQECVYNNLYRCIVTGRWWRNIQRGTAAKIRHDDFQTISRPFISFVVSEMFRRLTSTKNAII